MSVYIAARAYYQQALPQSAKLSKENSHTHVTYIMTISI